MIFVIRMEPGGLFVQLFNRQLGSWGWTPRSDLATRFGSETAARQWLDEHPLARNSLITTLD